MFKHDPPDSPGLALSDFHLFFHLKKFPSDQRQHFENDREAEMSVTQWFQSQAADFYDRGILKLVPTVSKSPNSGDKYVENDSTLAVSVPISLSIELSFNSPPRWLRW